MTEGLRQAGRQTGVDPALIEAWCELGYVVTEDNRHLFSVADIVAWEAAVRRHADNVDDDDDLDSENKPERTCVETRSTMVNSRLLSSPMHNAETMSVERSRAKAWQRLSVGGCGPVPD
jgi:hypothetical protein